MPYSDMALSPEMERIWRRAGRVARRCGYRWIEPPHLTIALLGGPFDETLPNRMLSSSGSSRKMRKAIRKSFSLKRGLLPAIAKRPRDAGECLQPVMAAAQALAVCGNRSQIGTDAIALALLSDPQTHEALLAGGLGIDRYAEVCNELAQRISQRAFTALPPVSAQQLLDRARLGLNLPEQHVRLPLEEWAEKALELAGCLAKTFNAEKINPGMLLLGIQLRTDAFQTRFDIHRWCLERHMVNVKMIPCLLEKQPFVEGWFSHTDEVTERILERADKISREDGEDSIRAWSILKAAEQEEPVKQWLCDLRLQCWREYRSEFDW